VCDSVTRAAGQDRAEALAREMAAMAIEIVPVAADLHLARQAAVYKAARGFSYADALAAALAKLRKAELVTGDPGFVSGLRSPPRFSHLAIPSLTAE